MKNQTLTSPAPTTSKLVNGIDVGMLRSAIAGIAADPKLTLLDIKK